VPDRVAERSGAIDRLLRRARLLRSIAITHRVVIFLGRCDAEKQMDVESFWGARRFDDNFSPRRAEWFKHVPARLGSLGL